MSPSSTIARAIWRNSPNPPGRHRRHRAQPSSSPPRNPTQQPQATKQRDTAAAGAGSRGGLTSNWITSQSLALSPLASLHTSCRNRLVDCEAEIRFSRRKKLARRESFADIITATSDRAIGITQRQVVPPRCSSTHSREVVRLPAPAEPHSRGPTLFPPTCLFGLFSSQRQELTIRVN